MKSLILLLIYYRRSAWLARLGTLLPVGMLDGELKKVTGLDEVIRKIHEDRANYNASET